MRISLLIILCVVLSLCSIGQDTTRRWAPDSWKRFEPGLRVSAGIQKKFFTEFGLGFQRYYYNPRHGFMVVGFYSSYEWIPTSSDFGSVNGVKVGAELVNNGAAGGIEVKYQFKSGVEDIVITPKYGFGMGIVNLFYGYNISTRKRPFAQAGKHQFSLVINSNLVHHHSKGKKSRR